MPIDQEDTTIYRHHGRTIIDRMNGSRVVSDCGFQQLNLIMRLFMTFSCFYVPSGAWWWWSVSELVERLVPSK